MANNNRNQPNVWGPGHRDGPAITKLLLSVLLSVGTWAGCQQTSMHGATSAITLAPPIQPIWSGDVVSQPLQDNQKQPENADNTTCGIEAVVLSYLNTGRQFSQPDPNDTQAGSIIPQGYVLRVIPLDRHYRAIPLDDAQLMIRLYPAAPEAHAKPMMSWVVPPDRLKAYWMRTQLLDGYLLRLSWANRDPPRGDYVLSVTVRCASQTGSEPIRETIYFSDFAGRP